MRLHAVFKSLTKAALTRFDRLRNETGSPPAGGDLIFNRSASHRSPCRYPRSFPRHRSSLWTLEGRYISFGVIHVGSSDDIEGQISEKCDSGQLAKIAQMALLGILPAAD